MMLRLCLALLRLIARVVPPRDREDWLREWEAELSARWQRLATENELSRRQQMDVLRRILGSFHDAAWLRRQFTRDSEMAHDLRHGARLLLRSPAFAVIAILVLALGIGATVGIFSVVDVLLLRGLPYSEPEGIVTLWQTNTASTTRDDVAPGNFLEWRNRTRLFERIAAVVPWTLTYPTDSEPVTLLSAKVSAGFFDIFGVQPIIGRTFTPDEFAAGSNVAVLNHAVWRQYFNADPSIVGKPIRFDDEVYTVVGVLPPGFRPRLLPGNVERGVWLPKLFEEWEPRVRGSGYWNVAAQLRRQVTLEEAQAELDVIAQRLAKEFPNTNTNVGIAAVPLRDHLAGSLRPALRILLGAVGLLLLIAAANVANLLLARGAQRQREIAVRAAMGAGRGRLVRQLLAESLLLAALGCAAGLLVAQWTLRVIVALSPADIPRLDEAAIDARVLGFAAALTVSVAIGTGIVPAWSVSGGRVLDVLRQWTPGASAGARQRLRATLVVAEVALAVLLMCGAGLLVRSFASLLDTEIGFASDGVAALQVFTYDRQRTPEKRALFVQQVIQRLKTVSAVEQAGAVSAMPFIEANINVETSMLVEGRPAPPQYQEPTAFITNATGGYFRAMRIPLREGRLFEDRDDARSEPVALVSDALARREWPRESAVGQVIRFRYEGRMRRARIVGVVGEVRHDGLDRPPRAEIFIPHAQAPFAAMTFVARVAGDPRAMLPMLKAQVHAVDPGQAIYRIATADELVSKSLLERRFTLTLLAGFALLAMVLAATGIYGVISLATTQRTREFGVRLALGADRREILGMVLRQGLALTVVGVAIGLVAALAGARALAGFLYGVAPNDPFTLGAVALGLMLVAMIACALPARRATRVDPLTALRAE